MKDDEIIHQFIESTKPNLEGRAFKIVRHLKGMNINITYATASRIVNKMERAGIAERKNIIEAGDFKIEFTSAADILINKYGDWNTYAKIRDNEKEMELGDKALTRAVGESSKRNNNVQIIAAVCTVLIIGATLWVANESRKLQRRELEIRELEHRERQPQKENKETLPVSLPTKESPVQQVDSPKSPTTSKSDSSK